MVLTLKIVPDEGAMIAALQSRTGAPSRGELVRTALRLLASANGIELPAQKTAARRRGAVKAQNETKPSSAANA